MKSKPRAMLSPIAWDDLKRLPGNLRREMITAIDDLENNLRPPKSLKLELEGEQREIRRLRVRHWRIIYAILEGQVVILSIRRRPPYDYEDLEALLNELG